VQSIISDPYAIVQASRKTKKKEGTKQRSQRATSNVFSMFDQSQIQEFKEVRISLIANRYAATGAKTGFNIYGLG